MAVTQTGPAQGLSPRIERLRDRALAWDEERRFGWRRDCLYLEGWMASAGQPLPLRNAEALAHVIENMPVRLEDDDLLAGIHGGDPELVNFRARQPAELPERVAGWPIEPERRERLLGFLRTEPFQWQELAPVSPWPPELERLQRTGVVSVWGTELNHSIRGYERVLRLGFQGLASEVDEALRSLDPSDPEAPKKRCNLLAFRRICEAASTLGRRHAAAARERARRASNDAERAEWTQIAQVCSRVPARPARTFREAVQALWFAHMITVWEDGVNANGIGRIDQFLLPYLREGAREREQAFETLAALWCKLYQPYDVQQMMVGGQRPDGADAVNDLSYLVLDVTEALGFVRCLSARLHRGSPRRFVERCVDLVARGGGIPFFFNDEALVPALVDKGVPVEEARGYAAIGCIEITIPGAANPHAVSHWINVAKCLELALNGGRDLRTGEQIGPEGPCLDAMGDMEAVRVALKAQIEHAARWAVYGSNAAEHAHRFQMRLPYLSLLTDDCVKTGTDIVEGGARYSYHSSAAMGIPNAADSMAALEEAVFAERRVSPAEMLDALRDNFSGRDDLRLWLLRRAPKYGNDEPLPDRHAADLTRLYCELLAGFRTPAGGSFHAHLFTFTMMLPYGAMTGATPDGRLAGEPLAYSVSPVQGRDVSGLSAVIRSLAALPHHLAAASSSAIVEVDPALLEGGGRGRFVDLLETAVDLGVGQLQFNVVSVETLRAAQADPERYRSLCVRVSGFSQQFCLLDRSMQDHIIARTKHRA